MSSFDIKTGAADDPVVYIKTRLTNQLFFTHFECDIVNVPVLPFVLKSYTLLKRASIQAVKHAGVPVRPYRCGESISPKQKSDLPEERQRLRERLKCSPIWSKKQSNISCF